MCEYARAGPARPFPLRSQAIQMSSPNETPAGGTRAKLILAFGVLMFAIGQALTFVVVAPLARAVGLTETAFGATLSIASLPLIFGAPFWGRRSDVVGRKPVFVIGLAGSAVGTLLVALVMQAGLSGWATATGVLVLLGLARACYGLVASAIYPAATAYMVDVTDFRTRSQGMAIIGASNGLGSVLGPLLAGALAFAGVLVPMYAAAAIGLIGAIATLLLLPEPASHRERGAGVKLSARDPRLRPFMIMWALFFLTFMAVQIVTAFYLQDRFGITEPKAIVRTQSLLLISMASVIVGVQSTVLQIFRVHPRVLLRLFGPAFVVALLLMAFAPNTWVLMAGFAVLGLAFACANPGINGGASLCLEPREQGAAAGFLSASNTVGAILGPVVGTSIYQIAPNAPMLVGAVALAVLSVYTLTVKIPDRQWGEPAGPKPAAAGPEVTTDTPPAPPAPR